MSSGAVNGLDESVSVHSVCLMKNLIFPKPVFTGGFDCAHKIQALSAWWLMNTSMLCVKKKNTYKTWSYLNGRFVSTGSLVLRICSVDLQEVFS